MKTCGFAGGFYESVQHIIDGFSVMKRITDMYPNTLYEGENIQALARKLGNLKFTIDIRERVCLFKVFTNVQFLSWFSFLKTLFF